MLMKQAKSFCGCKKNSQTTIALNLEKKAVELENNARDLENEAYELEDFEE
jgi:hypothetical protein